MKIKKTLPPKTCQRNGQPRASRNEHGQLDEFQVFQSSPRAAALAPFARASLGKVLAAMVETALAEGYDPGKPILHLVHDSAMIELNRRALGVVGPTNILSFPGGDDLPSELVLSVDTWRRESHIYGQDGREYFIFLMAHGLAHLAGLEHGREHSQLSSQLAHAALQMLKPFM